MEYPIDILLKFADILPNQAKELTEVIGIKNCLALVENFGGVTFPIPQRKNLRGEQRYQMLADAIGDDAALKVVTHYGGTRLYIPNCKDALRRIRNYNIIKEFEERTSKGESGNSTIFNLVLRYKLADRIILNIINKTSADDWLKPAADNG